jgi:anti-anti-sigma factor
MLYVNFIRWLFPPAEREIPADSPQVVAPEVPPRTALRPAARVPGVNVTISRTGDDMVVRVEGEARVDCAGALLDGLLRPSACRSPVVTLDLSGLRSISALAVGVLVCYRRSVVRTGGRVHLARQLQPAVRAALTRAGLPDLFETGEDMAQTSA